MADESKHAGTGEKTDEENLTKAQLQRRMEETRESISQTVEEIKETVTEQYETVKETVSGVLDYREQFQKDPLVWSVGALSAGFALGYTLGYAHKNAHAAGHKHTQLASFADSLVDELSTVGQSLIMPTLNLKIKELFGFDFSELLGEMAHIRQSGETETKPVRSSKAATQKRVKTSAGKSASKSAAQKRSTTKGRARKNVQK
ncbi:MAG TPA: hypothetical protein VGO91_10520 [Pyrinomonadaceae bacterium]|jgi:hypothetical protein|nr:hypothetical protein [Pyrinomonadaceae bacterium]